MNSKLHIVFLASWYPSRVFPSNGDFIQRHAEAVSLKNKVSILHVVSDFSIKNSIEISDTTINNVRTLIAYVKPTNNPLTKLSNFYKAYLILVNKAEPFQITHVHKLFPAGIISYLLKKTKNIPYLITEHHTIYHKENHKHIGFFQKQFSKLIAKNATFVCPVSNDLGKAMQNFGLRGNYKRVANVVDTEKFISKEKNNKIFTILHVSTMLPVKNIEGLLNVIKKIENQNIEFELILIGGKKDYFFDLAETKKINLGNIKFIDYVEHDLIQEYFQKANVFLLFSNVENLPCVIIEAFSCGTPVISTNVGGIAEFFPSNFGILVERENENQLEEAIIKMYNKDIEIENHQIMHEYAIKHFSQINICDEFTKLYYSALK